MEHSAASLEKSKANGMIDGYRNYFGIPIAGEPDYPQDISVGTWTNVPAGYLSSSAADMGKYLQMYLNGGNDIISKDSIDAMFYDSVSVDDDAYFYGMGWLYSTTMFHQPVLWHAGLVENYTSHPHYYINYCKYNRDGEANNHFCFYLRVFHISYLSFFINIHFTCLFRSR